jgi:hypothetical protein
MAQIPRQVGRVFRLSAVQPDEGTNQYILGDVSDGIVSTMVVWIIGVAGANITVSPKARPRNPEAAQPIAPPMPAAPVGFVPIPFITLAKAGAGVAPPVYGVTALVAADLLTGGACIQIPASGSSIALDCTVTAGEAWVYWTPCEGPAAI